MARQPKKEPGTEIVDWEAQMAAEAELAAGAQRAASGGGKFFSMKAGVLSFDGNPMPGNQMAVIILADILENSWYEGAYDPSTPASPKCFAFAHHEEALEPHSAVDNEDYFERQHDVCSGCPRNEWGSAQTGKGKDCKNVQRLSVIPAGQYKAKGSGRNQTFELEMYDDETHFAKAEEAFLKLPVMSVKHYAAYVKQLAADVRRPPYAVVTNVFLEPDPKSQFKVSFELIDVVDKDLLSVVNSRHKKAKAAIDFPYSPPREEEDGNAGRGAAATNNKLRGKAAPKKMPAKGGKR